LHFYCCKTSTYIFQIDYPKEAAKMMTQYNLPVDAPEFVRAKETAKNASDVSKLLLIYLFVLFG